MRIISKFKDYYDSCMRYGMDEKFVYLRKIEEIKIDPRSDTTSVDLLNERPAGTYRYRFATDHPFYDVGSGRIGVCGKTYPYFRVRINWEKSEYFYDYESFEKHFVNLRNSKDYEKKYERHFKSVERFFEENKVKSTDGVFIHYKAPIVVRRKVKDGTAVVTNPDLSKYKFYKIMDPFTIYQEIAMYLRNQLCDTKDADMPVGDDVVIAKSKGYDKWSFRKEPTKRNEVVS